MKLFIDVGNSRTKWAAWDGTHWVAEGSMEAGAETGWVGALPQKPEAVWIASVSAEARVEQLVQACRQEFGLEAGRLHTTASACGVTCAYAEPARLGVDRWLAIVAGWQEMRGPVVVFDCGTAITVDAVDGTGAHLGGLIIPGLGLMRRSLYSSTAGIPDEGEGDVGLLARDTRSAVTGGSLYAALSFMQRVGAELRGHLGTQTRILATGGDVQRLRPLLGPEFEWRPQLVLDGMRAVVEECR